MRRAFSNILEKRKEEGSRIKIVYFYEMVPVSVYRCCIVPQQSATIDGEPSFPIYTNRQVHGFLL